MSEFKLSELKPSRIYVGKADFLAGRERPEDKGRIKNIAFAQVAAQSLHDRYKNTKDLKVLKKRIDSVLDEKRLGKSFDQYHFDIAEKIKLREKAEIDALTSLHNRRVFNDRLKQELSESRRRNSQMGLILGDVRTLKYYNDTYGHSGGDRVLRRLSDSLKQGKHIRESDTVTRNGGDEFGIIEPAINSEDPQSAHSAKENLAIAALRTLHEVHRNPVRMKNGTYEPIHLDIGISVSSGSDNPASFYRRADGASYLAKKLIGAGKEQIVVATRTAHSTVYEFVQFDQGKVSFTPIDNAYQLLGQR